MIKPEINTLVIVLPKGNPPNPSSVCWGLILEKIGGTIYKIRTGKDLHDILYVQPNQIIPFLQTDGSFDDPLKVFATHEDQVVLHLMLNFLVQQGVIKRADSEEASLPEPISAVPIEPGTLSIVLPKNNSPPNPCWGIVFRRLIGGNYEIQIGRFRHLRFSKIIVQPEQLIPVYLTDGSFRNPRQAVRKLRPHLFLNMFLLFYSAQGSDFLRQIALPLSNSDFVLVSRRRKKIPKPDKKA